MHVSSQPNLLEIPEETQTTTCTEKSYLCKSSTPARKYLPKTQDYIVSILTISNGYFMDIIPLTRCFPLLNKTTRKILLA